MKSVNVPKFRSFFSFLLSSIKFLKFIKGSGTRVYEERKRRGEGWGNLRDVDRDVDNGRERGQSKMVWMATE